MAPRFGRNFTFEDLISVDVNIAFIIFMLNLTGLSPYQREEICDSLVMFLSREDIEVSRKYREALIEGALNIKNYLDNQIVEHNIYSHEWRDSN